MAPGKFAELLDVHPSQIPRWESGKHQPNFDTIVKWARVLGVPESVFMEDGIDGRVRESAPSYIVASTAEIITILDRDSRSSERRSHAAEAHAEATKIAEQAALERATAAKEWARAERIAQENARDLRRRLASSDPRSDEVAGEAERMVLDGEGSHPETGSR